MTMELLTLNRIGCDLADAWSEIQRSEPMLASPFFSAGFAAAFASARDDAEVAVLREEGEIVGFFPFQRDPAGGGRAIAEPVCDFQGLVAGPGVRISPESLVAGCGLSCWSFSHVIGEQDCFRPYRQVGYDSPFIDLSDGFEIYRAGRQRSGTQQLHQVERQRRQFEREVGPLHFEAASGSAEPLRALMRLKSEQYRRTGSYDRFAIGWVVALLDCLLECRGEDFGGMLSVLSTRGRLVAAHFGLRSRRIWHLWFPAYATEFARYSPGLILLVEMMRAAEGLGLERIDLGRGEALYKRRFMTGASTVYSGCVEVGPSSAALQAT